MNDEGCRSGWTSRTGLKSWVGERRMWMDGERGWATPEGQMTPMWSIDALKSPPPAEVQEGLPGLCLSLCRAQLC